MTKSIPADPITVARNAIIRLRERGFRAYVVGGAVRDALSGKIPSDLDIVSDATPEDIERIFPATKPVGRAFGVMLVIEKGVALQVSEFKHRTFPIQTALATKCRPCERQSFGGVASPSLLKNDAIKTPHVPEQFDRYSEPLSALARIFVCKPSSMGTADARIREDASLRDFTINTIYFDPVDCIVYDPVGGIDDLARKKVRFVGIPVERIDEDPERMLRYARFFGEFGGRPAPAIVTAISARIGLFDRISPERVAAELAKVFALSKTGRFRAIKFMSTTGMLEKLFPEVARLGDIPQPPEFHPEGDTLVHTLLLMKYLDATDFATNMGALLHDVGKAVTMTLTDRYRFNAHEVASERMAARICERLKCSARDSEKIRYLARNHMILKDLSHMRDSKKFRHFEHPHFESLLAVFYADLMSSIKKTGEYRAVIRERNAYLARPIPREPFITGKDLIALGYRPSPIFGIVLDELFDLQLENCVTTKEAALTKAKELFDAKIPANHYPRPRRTDP